MPCLHRGLAQTAVLIFLASAMALAAMVGMALMLRGGFQAGSNRPSVRLVLHCAAGIQPPVERVIEAYTQRYPHVEIDVDYQGSGTLLESIRIEKSQGITRSDLFLAADESYMRMGREAGLLAEIIPIASQRPVIAVKRGNPKGVGTLQDFLRADVNFAIADPDGAAIGRVTREIAQAAGLWDQIAVKRKMMVSKIPELVNAVTIGDAIDAALIWDATVAQIEAIDGVTLSESALGESEISVGIVATSQQPTAALHFARFLASRDQGQLQFVASNYTPVEADIWQDHPAVRLFAGSMFQAGVEQTIRDFELREGVTVDRIYNGCGILVAQMQAGGAPEAYLSCDTYYMNMVSDLFRDVTVLSENDMVMVVKQGNPHGIRTLTDLGNTKLRIGLCKPSDSALGTLTKRLLEASSLGSVYDNPTLMVATGPQLMAAITAGNIGGLDAAIVYRSNVLSTPETAGRVETIELPAESKTLSVATQPWAIAKQTDHSRLLGRLYDALVSESSRKRFTSVGFRWKLDEEPLQKRP